MNFERLEKNLISVVKEAQIKLGYESVSFGINYVSKSLFHLIDGANDDNLEALLFDFAGQVENRFGKIEIKARENGFALTIPPKGVDYVHTLLDEDEFLVRFINEIRNPNSTIDSITAIFMSYHKPVHIEKLDENAEFDYLLYFMDGEPDEFWYCIDTDDLGMTYHRFTKEDYLDFNF